MERDILTINNYTKNKNFNSHAHVERDGMSIEFIGYFGISTHTLTWSVTYSRVLNNFIVKFQLTRSRGAWRSYSGFKLTEYHFNSHAHVERDTRFTALALYYTNFNSHAHVERDTWCCVYLVLAQRDADLFFYLMGIGLILFTVRSQIAWHFHANLLGICGSLGVRWSKY